MEEVEHVARLARLGVPEAEREDLARELSDILEHMDRLNELDTEAVEPLTHVLNVKNALRPDVRGVTLEQSRVLKTAPDAHAPYLRVPAVVDKSADETGSGREGDSS